MDILDLKNDAAYEETHRRDQEKLAVLSDDELREYADDHQCRIYQDDAKWKARVGIVVFPGTAMLRELRRRGLPYPGAASNDS